MIGTVTEEVTRKEAPKVQCVTVRTQFLLGPSLDRSAVQFKTREKAKIHFEKYLTPRNETFPFYRYV